MNSITPSLTQPDGREPACDILFLIRSLGTGGAERQLAVLASRLRRRGLRVAVAVYEDAGGFAPWLDAEGVQVWNLRRRGRWDLVMPILGLRRLVRMLRPRIVHGYMSHPNLLVTLCRSFLRPARIVCGVRSSSLDLSSLSPITRWGERFHTWMLRRADLVICNSCAARLECIEAGIDAESCLHVPNGIVVEHFRFSPGKRAAARHAWGIDESTPLIGLVGRLHPMKNHGALLRALTNVALLGTGAEVVFVGEGDVGYAKSLRELALSLEIIDRVHWIGRQVDMGSVYSALDVLCLPSSDGEGFSNVLAEAMSCGVPCVASDLGDAAKVVGDFGWIVPIDDDTALAKSLAEALSQAPVWDRNGAALRVAQEFGADALAERTLQALATIDGREG